MNGENQQLVTDEPVEFEKRPVQITLSQQSDKMEIVIICPLIFVSNSQHNMIFLWWMKDNLGQL